MFPLTFSYWPAAAPFTVMLKLQLPPPASDPPVNAMVLVEAVVTRLFVPPHFEDVESAMVSPEGKTSENATLLNDALGFGLLMLNVSVDVPFNVIDVGEKFLVMLGGYVLTQPAKEMLSRYIVGVLPGPL
jgi:hypothetical protein